MEEICDLENAEESCLQLGEKYYRLGKLYASTHLYTKAMGSFTSALNNLEVVGEQASERVAEIHFELGNVYLSLESPERAIESLRHCEGLRRALGIPEDEREVTILNSLGIGYKQLGQCEEARRCYEEAVRKAERGRRSQLLLVNPLANLGGLLQAEGEAEAALQSLEQARQILRENQREGETTYASISESVMEVHFGVRNYREGLREANLIFRLFLNHRRAH